MQGLLQDWIDLEGTGNGEIIQSGSKWPNLDGYQDVVFWLDVAMVTLVSTELRIHYQTAPVGEPGLFTDMVTDFPMSAGTTPTVTSVLLSQNPLVPLSGLVRWRISAIAGGAWKVTFRIQFVAKRKGS
jgi:hypothetical protein